MIHLFTHTDLDGLGCAIVAKCLLNDVVIKFCDYVDVNEILNKFMESGNWKDCDKVVITDISPNDDTAEKLDKWTKYHEKIGVVLLDHHGSAEKLNKYAWAHVITEYSKDKKTSGTSLLYDFIMRKNFFSEHVPNILKFDRVEQFNHRESLEKFVDLVRMYDIWEWKTNPDGQTARKLQMIFTRCGIRADFINSMICDYIELDSDFDIFIPKHQQYIQYTLLFEETAYNESMSTYMDFEDKVSGYHVAMCFSNKATSIVCDRILSEHPEIDYIIAVNTAYKKLEFRSQRDDIDLGMSIAPLYGGGGHPQAAGAQLTPDTIEAIFKCIYSSKKSV